MPDCDLAATVANLRRLLPEAEGEAPEDTLGPPPWTSAVALPWEVRHGHDVRLGCLSVDHCAVVEAVHEAAVNALPTLLDAVEERDRLREAITEIALIIGTAKGRNDGPTWVTAEEVAMERVAKVTAAALTEVDPHA